MGEVKGKKKQMVVQKKIESGTPQKEKFVLSTGKPTQEEKIAKVFKLLNQVNKNIRLFKKTREEVKQKYPEMFATAHESPIRKTAR